MTVPMRPNPQDDEMLLEVVDHAPDSPAPKALLQAAFDHDRGRQRERVERGADPNEE
jgi:hypothetical protein